MKTLRKIFRKLDAIARDYFAPYGVADNAGTRKLCWTMEEAQSWLPYCSENAVIVETYDYTPLVKRTQYA